MVKEELLKIAIVVNDPGLFMTLIKDPTLNLNWSDNDGRTALHWAAITESGYEYAKLLLSHGANLNPIDKQGHTPLALAQLTKKARNYRLLADKQEATSISLPNNKEHFKHKKKSLKTPSVIIIGAGLAGLTAARELTHMGCRVTLLEARDRLGGRIDTIRLEGGLPVELGCQFIHGPGGNPLIHLLKKYEIELEPISTINAAIYDPQGKPVDLGSLSPIAEEIRQRIFSSYKQRVSESSEYKPPFPDNAMIRSFRNLVYHNADYTPHQRNSLLSYKLGYAPDHVGGNHLVINGLYRLPESLFLEAKSKSLLELRLNHAVKRIADRGNKVIVTADNNESFEADAAICTVPLKVLENIIFDPSLPKEKEEAIDRLDMAIHEKIILHFDQIFWPEKIDYLCPYDDKSKIWREIINLYYFSKGKTPALVISNHTDITQLRRSDKETVQEVLEILKNVFGNNISKLNYSKVTHWHDDPFSHGSYSYHTNKSSVSDNETLSKPYGRVCFAGEHTSYFPSGLDGAYLSGLQSAKDILQVLNLHLR